MSTENNAVTHGRISRLALFVFLALGAAGLAVFVFLYDRAFPEASLDFKITRGQAVEKSREFLAGQGFDLTGYQRVVILKDRRKEIDFLERNLGLKKANELFRSTVAVWRWEVRWFKELEETEYNVQYSPDGRLASFSRKLPEAAKGARPGEDEARGDAENFLKDKFGLDLAKYVYIERKTTERPDRLDQELVWRLAGFAVAGSEYRVSVKMQGADVGACGQWLEIPEAWTRSQEELGLKRQLLSMVDMIFMVLLYIGMAGALFWLSYKHGVRWKAALLIAGAAGVVTFLSQVNNLPFAFLDYETTQGSTAFWLGYMKQLFIPAAGWFVLMVIVFAAADGMGRNILGGRPWCSRLFGKDYLLSPGLPREVFAGYGLAFAWAGYVTLFYVLGEKYLGVWSPVDIPVSNSFSTYFPSFESITVGLGAAFNEELTFRLFAIAILYKLTKRWTPAVILSAMIWGFAHTNYPQEPIWIRGLELTIAGTVDGLIFLRFGLLTTIVSHYTYDAFVGVMPQLESHNAGLIANALFALLPPLILAGTVYWLRRRAHGMQPAEDAGPAEAVPEIAEAVPSEGAASLTARVLPAWAVIAFALVAGGIFAASRLIPFVDFFGDGPPVKLTKTEAAVFDGVALANEGFDTTGYSQFTEFDDDARRPPRYLINKFGVNEAFDKYGELWRYQPRWITKWYKEKTVRNYEIALSDEKKLLYFRTRVPEDEEGAHLDEGAAADLGTKFLIAHDFPMDTKWELIETRKEDRPHRLDYELTWRDRTFEAKKMERRLRLEISGDKVTGFNQPYYKVPHHWERNGEVARNSLRNTVRKVIAGIIGAFLGIFVIVQFILMLRKRVAQKEDVRLAAWGGLLFGAVPVLLSRLNALPSFYSGYFEATEQSLVNYALTEILTWVLVIIGAGIGAFGLIFFGAVALRAWAPESGGFRKFLEPLHPRNWGSTANMQGVLLGLIYALLDTGIRSLGPVLSQLLSPATYSPDAATTHISPSHVWQTLKIPLEASGFVTELVMVLVVVLFMRRFLKKDRWMIAAIVLLIPIFTGLKSLSWRDASIQWGVMFLMMAFDYVLIRHVLKWNLMAYLVDTWVELFHAAWPDFTRFLPGGSPAFFSPALQEAIWLALPILAVAGYGLYQRRKTGDRPLDEVKV